MRTRWWVAPVLLAAASQAAAQSGEWTTYGGNDWNQRYSTLKTISTSNVVAAGAPDDLPDGNHEAGLVREHADRRQRHDVRDHALQHGHRVRSERPRRSSGGTSTSSARTIYCCGPNNRGVAIHGGAHLYMGTLDAHLVALDAKDGKVLWDKEVADPAFGYSITHAPAHHRRQRHRRRLRRRVRHPRPRHRVQRHDRRSGLALVLDSRRPRAIRPSTTRRPTAGSAPGPTKTPDGADLHRDIAKEKGDSAKYADSWKTGGGGVWTTPAYDKESRTPSSWPSATRRRTSTAASARATTSTPTASSPSTRRQRQDQVVLPDRAARRLGPRRRRPRRSWRRVGGKKVVVHAGQDRLGLRARRGRPASWSAGATPSSRRRTCSPCRPRRAPGCCRAPTAARSGRRSRSIRRSTTPSSRRCTSR